MNKWSGTGRLTKDPVIRWTAGENPSATANFNIAVNRRYKKEGSPDADFIPCFAGGKNAEFLEKYFSKGMKIEITGRLETGSYTNKEGAKVFTFQVRVEELDFGESKKAAENTGFSNKTPETAAPQPTQPAIPIAAPPSDGFMHIPDGLNEDLPFYQ